MSGRMKRALQKLTAKQDRKSKNYDANMAIYSRGMPSSLPVLVTQQPSDPARVEKIKAQAEARRERRRNGHGTP